MEKYILSFVSIWMIVLKDSVTNWSTIRITYLSTTASISISLDFYMLIRKELLSSCQTICEPPKL